MAALPARFDAALEALGPFEIRPRLAVAVSGGADSLALCLLAAPWAAARGGEAVALTVDHGLRAGSAAEAVQVGAWLAARGLSHRILPWTGPKPTTGIQAAARSARYRLLGDWCRRAGVLHLLLGTTAATSSKPSSCAVAGAGRRPSPGRPRVIRRWRRWSKSRPCVCCGRCWRWSRR